MWNPDTGVQAMWIPGLSILSPDCALIFKWNAKLNLVSTTHDSLGRHVICWWSSTLFLEFHIFQGILEHLMRPSAEKFIFQQDLALAYPDKGTNIRFSDHGVNVLDWTENSPNLSPVQNKEDGRHQIQQCKSAINATWASVTPTNAHHCQFPCPHTKQESQSSARVRRCHRTTGFKWVFCCACNVYDIWSLYQDQSLNGSQHVRPIKPLRKFICSPSLLARLAFKKCGALFKWTGKVDRNNLTVFCQKDLLFSQHLSVVSKYRWSWVGRSHGFGVHLKSYRDGRGKMICMWILFKPGRLMLAVFSPPICSHLWGDVCPKRYPRPCLQC